MKYGLSAFFIVGFLNREGKILEGVSYVGKNGCMEKIRIGISRCLLGDKVRFDGQHKRDAFITETLSKWCDFVPVCPEVECGLPVPRESMRLVGTVDDYRLITGKTGIDHTERMESWARTRLNQLAEEDLVAFIFKTKSPSSGMRNVKIYGPSGSPVGYNGQGLFARAFMNLFPDTPVEDEGRLRDPGLRENFIETIFVLQRWRENARGGTVGDLVTFHSHHKYTLMAHSPEKLRLLGRIVARGSTDHPEDMKAEYLGLLREILSMKKTIRKNVNVLSHLVGYFKKQLSPEEKVELLHEVELYRGQSTPLIVPITLIRHYARKYQQEYLLNQSFLNPHPVEMGLLNHV